MNLAQVFLLSLLEGVTEFLPISSTGHLILASSLLGIGTSEFTKVFEITIQLGAILAVVLVYARSLLVNRHLLPLLCVAFLPTAVIGFSLYGFIKSALLGNVGVTVLSLGIGGVILLFIESVLPRKKPTPIARLGYRDAFLIGVGQSVSLIPGVSRAAATIIFGLGVGLSKEDAVLFSFLLAIPTMTVAVGYDLAKNASLLTIETVPLLVLGCTISALTAIVAMKWLLTYVKTHSFAAFGYYRIALALIYAILFL